MSAALVARGIGVSRGSVQVLHQVSVSVGPGQRVAVVGPNGVGKTTLLQVLAGELTPDTGEVRRAPASGTVVHVPQELRIDPGGTLLDHLARRTGVTAAERELHTAAEGLATGGSAAERAYSTALEAWLAMGGADLPERAEQVVAWLGLGPDLIGRGADQLSGGQAARLRLAVALLSRGDVLLLDEPTNDLDLPGLAALEQLVSSTAAVIVLVSHDREFLARTVTDVLEIDEFSRGATSYAGGWRAYLDGRAAARTRAEQEYADYAAARDSLMAQAHRQREWARSGAARAGNPSREADKHIRHREVQRSQRTSAKAVTTEARLARLEQVDEPREPWELRLSIASAGRGSEVVFALREAVIECGDIRLGPVDLEVSAGDRLRILGPNGSGKSTLIAALLGRLPLVAGRSRVGPGVVVGEMEQTRSMLRGVDPLLEVFRAVSGLDAEQARTLLAKFRFGADVVLRPADSLSPGERTRAGLAAFQARGLTCLVLDEPTNHLDLPAIEQLEQALAAYDGTLLLVTHDRRLAESVSLTHELDVTTLRA
ncbi:ABC-F family ATP-binding cassette domain-containing protein [soil metagenome]